MQRKRMVTGEPDKCRGAMIDMVDWCTQKAIEAIRNNLDGKPDDYDDFTLTELAETLDYLRTLDLLEKEE